MGKSEKYKDVQNINLTTHEENTHPTSQSDSWPIESWMEVVQAPNFDSKKRVRAAQCRLTNGGGWEKGARDKGEGTNKAVTCFHSGTWEFGSKKVRNRDGRECRIFIRRTRDRMRERGKGS